MARRLLWKPRFTPGEAGQVAVGRVGMVSFLLDQAWAATGRGQGARPGFWPRRLAGGGTSSAHVGRLWARPVGVLEERPRAGPGAGPAWGG